MKRDTSEEARAVAHRQAQRHQAHTLYYMGAQNLAHALLNVHATRLYTATKLIQKGIPVTIAQDAVHYGVKTPEMPGRVTGYQVHAYVAEVLGIEATERVPVYEADRAAHLLRKQIYEKLRSWSAGA